jgi:hypothetical protein
MSLEIAVIGFGLGLRLQSWPKARHVILHVGRVESRVVLHKGRGLGRNMGSVACLLLGGLLLGWTR